MPFQVPSSKSVTHRAYLLAALCDQPTIIHRPLRSGDCNAMRDALSQLGAHFEDSGGAVVVTGPLRPAECLAPLNVHNAGTALRLLMAQCARFQGDFTLTGDRSLQSRSNDGLLNGLTQLGVRVKSTSGKAPIVVSGPMRCGDVALKSGGSSQFGSALFLALAAQEEPSTIRLERPIHSRPYFDLSVAMARDFGASFSVEWTQTHCLVHTEGSGFRSPDQYAVEGDWSSAAFLLVGAFLLERDVTLTGLLPDSVQADRAIIEMLELFGAVFTWSHDGALTMSRASRRCPERLDVQSCPDLFPILCVLASRERGTIRIDGAPNLRHKESDRIQLMADGLASIGTPTRQLPDGLIIGYGDFVPSRVHTEADHRIHMSFRILSALTGGIDSDGAGSEHVSYPEFEVHLQRLVSGQD